MAKQLYDFLRTLLLGSMELVDQLFEGIPFAKDAILWALFVVLVMNLIVIPIRGYGASDRAIAKEIRAGRAESTRAIRQSRSMGKQLQKDAYTRMKNRGITRPRSFDDF